MNPGTATDPCAGPTPQTGVYCGTSSSRWLPMIDPQLKFWRDRLGEIRIRGTAGRLGGPAAGEVVFYLPAGSRPAEFHAFPVTVATSAAGLSGIATVFVGPDGRVRVLHATEPAFTILYLGDIHFRTDG